MDVDKWGCDARPVTSSATLLAPAKTKNIHEPSAAQLASQRQTCRIDAHVASPVPNKLHH